MNNLKKFQQFNESKLNEGFGEWLGGTLHPKKRSYDTEMIYEENGDKINDYFKSMVNVLISTFKIDNLKHKEDNNTEDTIYAYTHLNPFNPRRTPDTIQIYKKTLLTFINGEDITNLVNRSEIQRLLNFFDDKFNNKSRNAAHDTLRAYWYADQPDEDDDYS